MNTERSEIFVNIRELNSESLDLNSELYELYEFRIVKIADYTNLNSEY